MAKGGCHCGTVRYEAEVDTASGIECNCTHCAKAGLLLAFTSPDKFEQTAGADNLIEYLFNKRVIRHQVCATCGIQAFAHGKGPDGKDMVAINLRTVDGIDLAGVKRQPFDGLHKL